MERGLMYNAPMMLFYIKRLLNYPIYIKLRNSMDGWFPDIANYTRQSIL